MAMKSLELQYVQGHGHKFKNYLPSVKIVLWPLMTQLY
jgi:hypothetical protein